MPSKPCLMSGLLLLAIVSSTTLASAQYNAEKRKLYALADTAPEYCPNIETRWFVKGSIGYDMSSDKARSAISFSPRTTRTNSTSC
jgi:hypothetical protein